MQTLSPSGEAQAVIKIKVQQILSLALAQPAGGTAARNENRLKRSQMVSIQEV